MAMNQVTLHLADAFFQSGLQLIGLSRWHFPLEQCGVKGLAQGSNSCAELIMAIPGIEPPTLRVQVKLCYATYATGCPLVAVWIVFIFLNGSIYVFINLGRGLYPVLPCRPICVLQTHILMQMQKHRHVHVQGSEFLCASKQTGTHPMY